MNDRTILYFGLAALIGGALFGASQVAPVVASAPVVAVQATAPTGGKSVVTEAMSVNAGFYATGAPAWNGGIHSGVDYGAPVA